MKKCLYSILFVAFFAVLCSLGFSQNSFALTFGLQYGQSYGKLGSATVLRPWTDFGDNIIQLFIPSENKYILTGLLLYPSIPAKTAVGFAINNIDISWRQYNNGNASYFNGVNPCNYVSAGGITGMNYQISNCTYSAANGSTGGTSYYHVSFNLVAYATTSINIPANALYISIGNRASGFWENNILNTNTIYYNSFDYSSIEYYTSATDGLLQQQINQNQTIINQNQQIINEQQATTDAINEQIQQEQDQYNQEKQEESEREQSGNEDADQMSGIFQFSIPNPFLPILSMFTDGGSCVSIPTIASMVGSDNTQFCPWFPASVRNVLTPVIGLSSSIILFGFIISWLTGATRGSIEEVVEVSK